MRPLAFALGLLTIACGCKYGPEHRLPPPATDRLPNAKDDYKAYNRLGFQLFWAQEPNPEILVSPVANACLLTSLLNGSSGVVNDQLSSVLSVTQDDLALFNESQRALLNKIADDHEGTLAVGAAVWSVWPVVLDKKYVELAGANFGVNIKKLGGTGLEAVRYVNEFAIERTDGRVSSLVGSLDRSTQLFGTVVSSFHWQGEPFYEADQLSLFGSKVQAMKIEGRYPVFASDRYLCVRLSLGGAEVTLFIPKTDEPISHFSNTLNESTWAILRSSMVETDLSLTIPRFDFTTESVVTDAYKNEFSDALFDDRCNLRLISIEMERGYKFDELIEASAVRIEPSKGAPSAAKESYPVKLSAQYGCFFTIADSSTGAILLMGAVGRPVS